MVLRRIVSRPSAGTGTRCSNTSSQALLCSSTIAWMPGHSRPKLGEYEQAVKAADPDRLWKLLNTGLGGIAWSCYQ
eukprot:4544573-Heterocapsa_arctica.AAC.1